jgi:hypothetical protein
MVFRLIHTIENSRDTDVTQQPTAKQFNRPDERYRGAPDKIGRPTWTYRLEGAGESKNILDRAITRFLPTISDRYDLGGGVGGGAGSRS